MRSTLFVCAVTLLVACLLPTGLEAGDFLVGIGTHSPPDRGLALIQDAGVASVRDDIHWQEVEREKGVLKMPERYDRYVNETLRRGLKPLLVLCYGNSFHDGGGFPVSDEAMEAYTRFAEFVVTHFKSRVRSYEIWNEWNIGISLPPGTPHGKPQPYVALLRKVYPRLHAIDPEVTVIGGALSGNGVEKGWLEEACRAGLLESLDAFSFHPYCYRQGARDRLPETGFLRQIRDSQEVTRRYQKREVPIYLTEVGWPTHTGPDGTTPEESALFLARTFLLARTLPFVRGLWWYDLRDDGPDPAEREHHFGVVTLDYAPKPAYAVLRGICRLFQGARFAGEIKTDDETHILKFRKDSGATLFAMWSTRAGGSLLTLITPSATAQPQPKAKLSAFDGREIAFEQKQPGSGGPLRLRLTGAPCILECDPAPPDDAFHLE